MRKYFGTDGVRGIANLELTAELAYKLAKSAGEVFKKEYLDKKPLAVIGTDTRASGDMLKSALISGFTSVGMDCADLGIITTPAVAYLTRHYHADLGVVVSASHNPMEYNGIKFFNSKGLKLDDNIELEIEKLLENDDKAKLPTHQNIGRLVHPGDPKKDYQDFLLSQIKPDLSGYKVVLDCANGAGGVVAPGLYKILGADVITTFADIDGIHINDGCGSTHPENLAREVVRQKADFGFSYDGDADRLIAIDEKGEIVDGDKLMLIFANYLKNIGRLKNDSLVVTVMSNMGLFVSAENLGINLEVTDVGDRYVMEGMLKGGHIIGGEQSGHIILLEHNTTGDGILSSLMLSEIISSTHKKLSELASIMDIYPQVLINVKVDGKYKKTYAEIPNIKNLIEKTETALGKNGRLLIRPSGTEPLIRVMIEGKDLDHIKSMAEEIADIIKKECV